MEQTTLDVFHYKVPSDTESGNLFLKQAQNKYGPARISFTQIEQARTSMPLDEAGDLCEIFDY
jgi:hypothetical protein